MLDMTRDEHPSGDASSPDDRAALIDASLRHRRRLYVLCRRWVGGAAADAEDIVSGVIVKALEEAGAHAVAVVSYPAWLTRLAWNLSMDLHRERAYAAARTSSSCATA